jgi:hypothetical protein
MKPKIKSTVGQDLAGQIAALEEAGCEFFYVSGVKEDLIWTRGPVNEVEEGPVWIRGPEEAYAAVKAAKLRSEQAPQSGDDQNV